MARNAFITWYKMFVRLESVFEAAPDEAAGRALKASFVYARTGEVPELTRLQRFCFHPSAPALTSPPGRLRTSANGTGKTAKRAGGPPSTKAKKKPKITKRTQITQLTQKKQKIEVRR